MVTLCLVSLYVFLVCWLREVGIEVAYGGWIPVATVMSRHITEAKGAYLSSGFWGGITLGIARIYAISAWSLFD